MKKMLKKSLAVLLAVMMLSCSFSCLAAVELNQDAANAHYGQYENYVLLGDSAASGYRDEVTDNDYEHNKSFMHSTYYRYTGSYSDIIANAIIKDKSMTALAAPGFRTIEVRYMLEDDYAAACEDEYLFHPSQLYAYEDETCACHGEKLLPGSEHFRELFKTSITEADLITLGIGGNDWGAYLTWVIADILEAENVADKYITMAKELISSDKLDMSTVEKLVEIAHIAGALPALLQQLPQRLNYGLSTFYANWDLMIEDIYALNDSVTLMVVGMSDNSLKGKYYDYNGVTGEVIATEPQPEMVQTAIKTIVDFIMTVGNTPMIEGAKKYGYTYVDITGTTYVESHPDADGHVHIANKIIEALPDREIAAKYDDVKPGNKYYASVEYVLKNGIMSATSETTFSPDDELTAGQLADALFAIAGKDNKINIPTKVNVATFAIAMLSAGATRGFTGFFKGVSTFFRVIIDSSFNVTSTISRGQAAVYFHTLCA